MVLVDQSIPKLFFCHLSIQKKRYINNRINFLQTMGFLILIHNSLEFWIMTFKKMYRIKSVDRLWLQTVRLHLRNRKLQEYYCSKNKKVWIIFRTPTFFFSFYLHFYCGATPSNTQRMYLVLHTEITPCRLGSLSGILMIKPGLCFMQDKYPKSCNIALVPNTASSYIELRSQANMWT